MSEMEEILKEVLMGNTIPEGFAEEESEDTIYTWEGEVDAAE